MVTKTNHCKICGALIWSSSTYCRAHSEAQITRVPWNKGLTKETNASVMAGIIKGVATKLKDSKLVEFTCKRCGCLFEGYGNRSYCSIRCRDKDATYVYNSGRFHKGSISKNKIEFTDQQKEEAKRLYVDDKMTPPQIGGMMGYSGPVILRHLKEMNIKIRNLSESKTGISIERFKGTLEERYGPEKAEEIRQNMVLRGKKLTGPLNPFYGKKHTNATKQKLREANKGKLPPNTGKVHLPLEKNPAWKGGISYESYDFGFSPRLKKEVRERDGHKCMVCSAHEFELRRKLNVHHINYDKQLSIKENLVSLCDKCHGLTNYKRKYWTRFFQDMLSDYYNYNYNQEGVVLLNVCKMVKKFI